MQINISINFIQDGSLAYRGCSSDNENDGTITCKSSEQDCFTCFFENCNYQEYKYDNKTELSCFSCNSEGPSACAFTQENSMYTEKCKDQPSEDQYCYTFANKTHFMRGCLSEFTDSPELCQDNCKFCQTNDCNNAQLIEQICYECDSSIDEKCISDPPATNQTLCDASSLQNFGCYHYEKGNKIINIIDRLSIWQ